MKNVSHLTEPLLERAAASACLPYFGFIDRAAEALVGRLGIGAKQLDRALASVKRDASALIRCQWIDKQIATFFNEHPEGKVVEVGCGLSTRFHRLSYANEWPKFSWLAVDTESVVESVSRCFPATENYAYFSCESDLSQCFDTLSISECPAYFFVFEQVESSADTAYFFQLCRYIVEAVGHAHLIADLDAKTIQSFGSQVQFPVYIKDSFPINFKGQSLIQRITPFKSYSKFKAKTVCHLSFGEEKKD